MDNNLPVTTDQNEVATREELNNSPIEVTINCVKTESRQDKINLINALESADNKLVDCIGKVINIAGVYAETHFSKKKQKQVCRVLVIDVDGKSYATGSFVFMNSLKSIIEILGAPTDAEPLKITIVERQMEKGTAVVAKVSE